MELKIGKPYLESGKGTVRLCAQVKAPGEQQTKLFFEVDKKWGEYLVTELSDAFVLAVLKRAMKHGWDICYETPMSEDLCYQLTAYGIPVLSGLTEIYSAILLKGETTDLEIPAAGKAGTGFSGGVDSFYSVLKHKDSRFPKHEVTHLVLARNGAASSSVPQKLAREWYDASSKKLAKSAAELGMEYIGVWSDIPDFYRRESCGNGCLIQTSSFIHALRKLFKNYYWASTFRTDVIDFQEYSRTGDGGFIDPFLVPLVSVDGLRFHHSGGEASRIEKVEYIADFPVVQRSLTVCGSLDAGNCGNCVKCLRTMAELNSIGKLEQFQESFPVKKYLKHWTGKLAFELALDHPPFTTDILKTMEAHGKKVPAAVFMKKWCFYTPYRKVREALRDHYAVRKLYYMLKLDEKTGQKHSREMKRLRLEECKRKRR